MTPDHYCSIHSPNSQVLRHFRCFLSKEKDIYSDLYVLPEERAEDALQRTLQELASFAQYPTKSVPPPETLPFFFVHHSQYTSILMDQSLSEQAPEDAEIVLLSLRPEQKDIEDLFHTQGSSGLVWLFLVLSLLSLGGVCLLLYTWWHN